MSRVILTLVCICQSFCLRTAEVGFSEPGVFGRTDTSRPRIVIVRDPRATHALVAQADVVRSMVSRGVIVYTGQPTEAEAWRSLVSTNDVIGVKVHSVPGQLSGTRPAVAAAVIKGLLDAGHPASGIILWDRRLADLRNAGFVDLAMSLGVRCAGAVDEGFDAESAYENPVLGQLVFGDLEFRRPTSGGETNPVTGRKSHLSRLLTREITRHIHIAPLLNHNSAGVSGILYTVARAATDNFHRFESNPSLLASAVPEIYGRTNIADHVALNIVDALIGQYEGWQTSKLQYSGVLNELRFSSDPVALDVLSLDELSQMRTLSDTPVRTNRFELYLNARLMELGVDDLREVEIIRAD